MIYDGDPEFPRPPILVGPRPFHNLGVSKVQELENNAYKCSPQTPNLALEVGKAPLGASEQVRAENAVKFFNIGCKVKTTKRGKSTLRKIKKDAKKKVRLEKKIATIAERDRLRLEKRYSKNKKDFMYGPLR